MTKEPLVRLFRNVCSPSQGTGRNVVVSPGLGNCQARFFSFVKMIWCDVCKFLNL